MRSEIQKSATSLVFGLVLLGTSAVEAAIYYYAPDQMIGEWERLKDPLLGQHDQVGWRVASSGTVLDGEFPGSALVLPDPIVGDFSFHARIAQAGTWTQRFGLVFGYQDASNNYRLSWSGNPAGAAGLAEADGTDGLSLVKESGGTSVSLFNEEIYWEKWTYYNLTVYHKWYDLSVSRSGEDISFDVTRVSDGVTLAQDTFQDATFMSGRVGLWDTRQHIWVRNVSLNVPNTAIPEPATLAIWSVLGMTGIGFGAWRRRRKA